MSTGISACTSSAMFAWAGRWERTRAGRGSATIHNGSGRPAQSDPGLCMRCLSYIHQAIPNHSTRTGVAVAATAHKSSAAVDVARMEAVPGQ